MRRSASQVKTLKVPPQVSYRAGRWRSKRNLSNIQRAAIPSTSFRGATYCVISKRYCTSKYPEKGELGSKPQGPTHPHLSVHPTQEIVSVYLLWVLEGCLFFSETSRNQDSSNPDPKSQQPGIQTKMPVFAVSRAEDLAVSQNYPWSTVWQTLGRKKVYGLDARE